MKCVYIEETGGPEVVKYGEQPRPELGADQVLIRVAAAGVNFIDTYHRTGLYKMPLPGILGSEGAGVVEEVAKGVQGFQAGDRVAWTIARGSYAEYAAVAVKYLVKIPGDLELLDAAAVMLQGLTAHYLTHSTFQLKPGHTALIHAAAGGTGRLLVQMAKIAGARVIATAGSSPKLDVALQAGADDVIDYSSTDFVSEVKRLTGGAGVDVVYDSVGRSTFMNSLDCLRTRGMIISLGNASGAVAPIEPLLLAQKGSLFLTRPTLSDYIASRDQLDWRASDLFRWIANGKLRLLADRVYKLAEAGQAHKDLEGRKTTGKLVLLV